MDRRNGRDNGALYFRIIHKEQAKTRDVAHGDIFDHHRHTGGLYTIFCNNMNFLELFFMVIVFVALWAGTLVLIDLHKEANQLKREDEEKKRRLNSI
jgi:hypothetical protein